MTRRLSTIFLASVILVLTLSGRAVAQSSVRPTFSTQSEESFNDIQVVVVPFYAWLTGMSGTLGMKGNQTNFDYSFADLARWVNFAATGHVEVIYRNHWGMLGEFNYAWLGDQNSNKNVIIDRQTSLALTDVAAFYRFDPFTLGKSGGGKTYIDLLAGARIWDFSLRMNINTSLGGQSAYQQAAWADPIAGARALIELSDKWLLEFRGGVGGFGVSSAFTWDAMGLIGWTVWEQKKHTPDFHLERLTLLAGYRAIGDTYDRGSGSNSFKYHTVLNGPVAGVAFVF
jgi:hypothetical protein